jgi:hypothetical protein
MYRLNKYEKEKKVILIITDVFSVHIVPELYAKLKRFKGWEIIIDLSDVSRVSVICIALVLLLREESYDITVITPLNDSSFGIFKFT